MEAISRVQQEVPKESLQSLGFFDNASPNYYTYYPEVKPEDLNPQDTEFIFPVFRLLSQIVIYPTRLAIDFTEPGVLKKSMPLLKGQSIYVDHEMTTGNVMGSISEVFWQDGYTADGIKVPAGINGVLMIDGKSNPRVARAIMMKPPAIHSSSVQIQFAWKPSHKFKDEQEFFSKLGTYDNKGVLVRKVVEEVLRYAENSLVPHGMDPFAKKLEDGKIVLAKQAQKIYSMQFSDKVLRDNPYLAVTATPDHTVYQMANMVFSEIVDTTPINITPQQSNTMLEDLLLALNLNAEQFPDLATLTEHLTNQAAEVTRLTAELETATASVTTLIAEKANFTSQLEALQSQLDTASALADASLSELRTDAKKFYSLVRGDKAEAAILASLDTLSAEAVQAFRDEYETAYNEAVPLTCQDCHSTNVSRKTSAGGQLDLPSTNLIQKLKEEAMVKANQGFIKS